MSDDSDILTLAMCEDVISVGPSLDSVLAVLTASGISAKTLSMPQQSSEDLTAFLRAQHVPVFVLHHYDANSDRGLMELQSNGSDTSSTTPVPLTEAQIAQYQVHTYDLIHISFHLSYSYLFSTDCIVDRSRDGPHDSDSSVHGCWDGSDTGQPSIRQVPEHTGEQNGLNWVELRVHFNF